MKTCSKCFIPKLDAQFYKGYSSCIDCTKARMLAYYYSNQQRLQAYQRAYYAKNPKHWDAVNKANKLAKKEYYTNYSREYSRWEYATYPERVKARNKRWKENNREKYLTTSRRNQKAYKDRQEALNKKKDKQ